MTAITLESLGITNEALIERVVERIARDAMTEVTVDEDGDDVEIPSRMKMQLDEYVRATVDRAVNEIAEKHLLPRVTTQIEEVVIQRYSEYGRMIGQPVGFVEYLVQRADAFMHEEVDSEGKARRESQSSFWHKAGPRLAVMIDKHINSTLTFAISKALADANCKIGAALKEAVNTALAEVVGKVKVEVKTR